MNSKEIFFLPLHHKHHFYALDGTTTNVLRPRLGFLFWESI